MESFEQGVLTAADTNGLDLRFGSGPELLAVIEQIGHKEGVGELLSEGSRVAASRTGGGSEAWAMHVKGLEMPGFHPGRLRHLALALAVSPRGACHNKASAYDFDLSDDAAQRADASEIGRAVAEAEDFAAVLDSWSCQSSYDGSSTISIPRQPTYTAWPRATTSAPRA